MCSLCITSITNINASSLWGWVFGRAQGFFHNVDGQGGSVCGSGEISLGKFPLFVRRRELGRQEAKNKQEKKFGLESRIFRELFKGDEYENCFFLLRCTCVACVFVCNGTAGEGGRKFERGRVIRSITDWRLGTRDTCRNFLQVRGQLSIATFGYS